MTTLRGRSGASACQKKKTQAKGAAWCRVLSPLPAPFTPPSTLMSRICKERDQKAPRPSASTWQPLGDANSWWEVESGLRGARERLTGRGSEGGEKGASVRRGRRKYSAAIESQTDERCSWRRSPCSSGNARLSLDTSPCWGMKDGRSQDETQRVLNGGEYAPEKTTLVVPKNKKKQGLEPNVNA